MVVGEYVEDYGFPLPKPVSIHREYLRRRLSDHKLNMIQ